MPSNRQLPAVRMKERSSWLDKRIGLAHGLVPGRLDPAHPDTCGVLGTYEDLLSRIDPGEGRCRLLAAGELAGRAAREVVGGYRIAAAFDRVELIRGSLTAILARCVGLTEDTDFDVAAQLTSGREVLCYDQGREAADE